MIKVYQRYTVSLYLKNFFVIFFALEFFYTGIDLLTNYKDLPDSANLQLLYVLFNFMSAINYVLPLSIIFAMIVSKFSMIRSNELIALYAAGISKNALILPTFITSMAITISYILLNFTSFVYAQEYKSNILKYNQIISTSSELFLKYEGKYIYFGKLDPLKQEAKDVKIFDIEENELKETISAKSAYFQDNIWTLQDAYSIKKPIINQNENIFLSTNNYSNIKMLEGFKPKIIENTDQTKSTLSALDAIDAISFFGAQGINVNSIKANLYLLIVFPFFAPLFVVAFYYYLPVSVRFFNLALVSFVFIFITLSLWGILFVLGKFAANSVIAPELAIVLPIFLLSGATFYLYRKNA